MYCSAERLETMFNQAKNEMPIEVLINAEKAGPGSVDNRTIVASDSNNETGYLLLPKPRY